MPGQSASNSMPQMGGLAMKQPEKDWCDLTADEKIERNRLMTKNTMLEQAALNSKIYKLERFMRDHSHHPGGTAMLNLRDVADNEDIGRYRLNGDDNILDKTGKTFF